MSVHVANGSRALGMEGREKKEINASEKMVGHSWGWCQRTGTVAGRKCRPITELRVCIPRHTSTPHKSGTKTIGKKKQRNIS